MKYESKKIMSIIFLETLNIEWGQIDPKSNRRVKKHINYFKLRINEHVMITNVHDFSKTFMIYVFSRTFPGLEMTI